MAADRDPRPLLFDPLEQRRAAEVVAARRSRRSGPWAASGGRGPRPRGSRPSSPPAAASSRSKLQSQGVTGTPAPRPKNSTPSIVRASPCRTAAASQPAAASRSASSVSLLPGTRTVGVSIAASAAIVSLEPLVDRGEVAGADHDVGLGRHLDQLRRLVEVAVQVAEGEELHRRETYPLAAGRGPSRRRGRTGAGARAARSGAASPARPRPAPAGRSRAASRRSPT